MTNTLSNPVPEPCPQGVRWCTEHITGSVETRDEGTEWHRTNTRRSETWSGIYDTKPDGVRVHRMYDVDVEGDWMTHRPDLPADMREPAHVTMSVDHSDCTFFTPEQALELAAHLVETAGELLGQRLEIVTVAEQIAARPATPTRPTLAELIDAHQRMLQRIAESSAEMAQSRGAGAGFARAARATLRRIDAATRIRAAMLEADR